MTALDVPNWPVANVVVHDDDTATLTINGHRRTIVATPETLRLELLAIVRDELALELQRPVRLHTLDPDGREGLLAVPPAGPPTELPLPRSRPSGSTAIGAPRGADTPRAAQQRRHSGLPARLALVVCVLAAAGATAAIVLGALGATDTAPPKASAPHAAHLHATRTRDAPTTSEPSPTREHRSRSRSRPAQRAAASRARAATARRTSKARRLAARKRAYRRRLAARHAAARRRDRASHPTGQVAPRAVVPSRPSPTPAPTPAPAPAPAPAPRAAPPAPRRVPSPPSNEFDF